MSRVRMRRALLSVSDKKGLVELARGLARHGIELVSTGGTQRALAEAGLAAKEVADVTGFPEILGGRVKTLHPAIHGGILHRRDVPAHVAAVEELGIDPIDVVVVNLYPFEATVARPGVSLAEAIENIDIGGPSMIRSAAKNHSHVAVLTDPSQYAVFLEELDRGEGTVSTELLAELGVQAFARTADYDAAIRAYLSGRLEGASGVAFPNRLELAYEKRMELRYGENPHQKAAFYVDPGYRPASLARARQRHGKELSYNNLLDLDAALSIVRELSRPACIVIKHNNPCGAATADRLVDAFRRAWDGDPVSAFGSVLSFNRTVDEATAMALVEPGRFVEAILAPAFEPAALEALTTRPSWKKNVRLLEIGELSGMEEARRAAPAIRQVEGGLLCQSPDLDSADFAHLRVVTRKEPTASERADLAFAWTIAKFTKSNAIVLAKGETLVGVGAGQMSRVDSVHLAARKAGERSRGSAMASDAFFPFRDNVDQAAAAGVTAIVQPGGSVKDQDSIDACDQHGIAMVFTGVRHFRH